MDIKGELGYQNLYKSVSVHWSYFNNNDGLLITCIDSFFSVIDVWRNGGRQNDLKMPFSEFVCETDPYDKSSGEMVCGVPLPFKVTFSKAVEICKMFGARLPEIYKLHDQRMLERKKVSV